MSHSPRVVSSYLHRLLLPELRGEVIARCIADIQRSGVEFEAIAFTGVSGALIAPILAQALTKSIIVVRKKDDSSTHSADRVEGDAAAERYIIADDIVDSGKTVFNIVSALSAWKDKFKFDGDTGAPSYFSSVERKCVGVIASNAYAYQSEFVYHTMDKHHHYRNLGYRGEQ